MKNEKPMEIYSKFCNQYIVLKYEKIRKLLFEFLGDY